MATIDSRLGVWSKDPMGSSTTQVFRPVAFSTMLVIAGTDSNKVPPLRIITVVRPPRQTTGPIRAGPAAMLVTGLPSTMTAPLSCAEDTSATTRFHSAVWLETSTGTLIVVPVGRSVGSPASST